MINLKINNLKKEELVVCRILYFAINNKHGICDPTNFSKEDEKILLDFQEKGYLHLDGECIVLTKEFKVLLEKYFSMEEK